MTMQLMTAKQARNQFGTLMNAMQREPVFITKNNKPVGAFISIEDLEGTYLADLFTQADEDYQAWVKSQVTKAVTDFQKHGSQGRDMETVHASVMDKVRERLTANQYV